MRILAITCSLLMVMAMAGTLPAQDHGGGGGGHGGGGGGAGCGDVFGDLIHILRYEATGRPILAKRYIELPREIPGYGWGYCPIALTAEGAEISYLPYSCDLNLDLDGDGVDDLAPVEVNYFGRLSGGRTKERNHRMHLNEVLSNIKMAGFITQEPVTGRLMIGYDCEESNGNGSPTCAEWSTIDSPMESMALYTRLMKYGHLQTDPQELDNWYHGDPAGVPPFNPALEPNDWQKFARPLWHLLPGGEGFTNSASFNGWLCYQDSNANGVYDPPEAYVDENDSGEYETPERFADANGNGVRDEGDWFDETCAAAHSLSEQDFIRAGSLLGAAANKTGKITEDLTQYMNRILKITLVTETTQANPDTLPVVIRDCTIPGQTYEPPPEDGSDPVDPPYLYEGCTLLVTESEITIELADAHPDLPDVYERFVDYSVIEPDSYDRNEVRGEGFDELILPPPGVEEASYWNLSYDVSVMDWLEISNGPPASLTEIQGFVLAASDALRSIEFVHNYAVPVYLPYELEEPAEEE